MTKQTGGSVIISPLTVPKNKRGDSYSLNLNIYRNTHYQTLNKVKKAYTDIMVDQIQRLPRLDVIRISYTLFPATKQLCDVANVCAVIDKFFCDALVKLGKLPDDNYVHLPSVTYEIGEVDKTNPRVEIRIYTMKITKSIKIDITQEDVEQAIRAYIASEDPTIIVDEIDFAVKRGGDEKIAVSVSAHFAEQEQVELAEVPTESVNQTTDTTPASLDDVFEEPDPIFKEA